MGMVVVAEKEVEEGAEEEEDEAVKKKSKKDDENNNVSSSSDENLVLLATATIAGCNVAYNAFPTGQSNQVDYFGGIAVYDFAEATISDTLVSYNEAQHNAGVVVESSQVKSSPSRAP